MVLFLAPETWPFGAALAVMVGLAVIEGAGMLIAHSPSAWIDGLLPDLPHSWEGALGWLHPGKVPILVLFILFLGGFSVAGYVVQAVAHSILGTMLPAWLAAIPAWLAGLSTLKFLGGLIAQVFPGDETTAVSEQTFIGRTATVIAGIARQGLAAQAKVRDANGNAHYVMVEPDIAEQSFAEGTSVLLVRKAGTNFRCIANPHPELL